MAGNAFFAGVIFPSVLVLFWSDDRMPSVEILYLILVMVLGLVTFVAYGWDKYKAQQDGWRTKEKTLHILALVGGWLGAIVGQQYFRHKTKKWGFLAITYAIATLHLTIVAWLVWNRFSSL